MAQDLKTLVEPNVYECSNENTQISYFTSAIDGAPRFSYKGPKGDRDFSGDEIRTLDSELGTEVTVTLEDIADLRVLTFTLLVPEMWVAPGTGLELKTIGIYVVKAQSLDSRIGAPAARESYGYVPLVGEGRLVES
ncbi:MAG TPA: hypothetical protein VGO80_13720 [Solirubrobacteraceae bacterium]|jgi:hypothetical protein|nr:hypothetical protein [Solirubrobacteraceae bacterium]